MTARTTPVVTEEQLFAEEVYGRLPEAMEYVAQYWFEGLLQPLGYERCDQSRVAQAIRYLVDRGRLTRASVRVRSGYHAKRRSEYPNPRSVMNTKTKSAVSV
jgi:hypothetical protein